VTTASELSRAGRVYLRTVIGLGFLVIAESLLRLYRVPVGPQWLLLAALTLISGSASVKLPWAHVSISISEAFVFTAVLLYGPAAGTVTVALDGLVISFWIAKRRPELHRALFNIAAPALSAWCSSHLFFYVSGIAPLVQRPSALEAILPSLVLFALTYYGLNSWLIAFVIAIEKKRSPWQVWRHGFIWLSLNYFCGASVAVLLVGSNRTIDLRFVGVVVPLLLVLYFTFKTSMQRVEDANNHLDQLNSLYLSTIETLAMAIDAKDQVTHGHIRRVQSFATRLAREIGVRDTTLIKAIEAAALLHDMGKLAVPEYILNKPGKLTPAEFEKMKLHASVGADILSAIAFPYPVVPIVRHHHENWDGTGYPEGLKGTDIPIGARILSVVDCFDALTSDRPYRPRLSSNDALAILNQRRGSMYDPLIVDTFVRMHQQIASDPLGSGVQRLGLHQIAGATQAASVKHNSPRLDEITAGADEMLTLYELSKSLTGQRSVSDTGDVIGKHLRRLVPSSLSVFYAYDAAQDELIAVHALGDATSMVNGIRIPLGQRLSGWVAANRQVIANSDPTLDLGDIARSTSPRLKNCLSTPLIVNDELIGVLTLYSSAAEGFSDNHRRIVELIAPEVSRTLKRATEFDRSAGHDLVTGLPNSKQLATFVESARPTTARDESGYTLLFVDIVDLKQINSLHGRHVGDDVLRHVVQRARTSLRLADVLYRYESDELVAVVNDANAEMARAMAQRIRDNVRLSPLMLKDGTAIDVNVDVAIVNPPLNDRPLADLIAEVRPVPLRASSKHGGSTIH
jgi:diguanylate cyclase (GGDEF)-like protein/putative nucleotidyltransferase with HDIG domain